MHLFAIRQKWVEHKSAKKHIKIQKNRLNREKGVQKKSKIEVLYEKKNRKKMKRVLTEGVEGSEGRSWLKL